MSTISDEAVKAALPALPKAMFWGRRTDGVLEVCDGEKPANRSGGYSTPWAALYDGPTLIAYANLAIAAIAASDAIREREQAAVTNLTPDTLPGAKVYGTHEDQAGPDAYQRRSIADGIAWTRWTAWDERDRDEPFPASTGRWLHEYRSLYLKPASMFDGNKRRSQPMSEPMNDEKAIAAIRFAVHNCRFKCEPDARAAVAHIAARLAQSDAIRAKEAQPVGGANAGIRTALEELIRTGKKFRNTVVETRGVLGMDNHDAALRDAESALRSHQPTVEGESHE